jgi:HlyD family secretion protein
MSAQDEIPNPIKKQFGKWLVTGLSIVVVAVIGLFIWVKMKPTGPGEGFVSGNGRIEATEVDIATKLSGRVEAMMVDEGDFVTLGQPLAEMQIDVLEAQRDEALAQSSRALTSVASAQAQVAARMSDTAAAQALVVQRESELDAAQRRLDRTNNLVTKHAIAEQTLDDDRADLRSATAARTAAIAQVEASRAAIHAAESAVTGAKAGVMASEASIARIEADILDSHLKAPRAGRVQYRVAQPGEVIAAGGKVLNMVDLSDVYMTFFLPETVVGKIALGSEVHLILDAAARFVIPARVSYVASTAQFTPKTVETESERQKLMFRVKARLDPDLLRKNIRLVKTGVPGVAWLKIDPKAVWPDDLKIKVPE